MVSKLWSFQNLLFSIHSDDEPDGPNDPHHYIILTGITDTALIHHLVEMKIPLHAIIDIQTDYQVRVDEQIKNEESMDVEMAEADALVEGMKVIHHSFISVILL